MVAGTASLTSMVYCLVASSTGQKFPSRSLETSLNATVTFQDDVSGSAKAGGEAAKAAAEFVEDPFCVGLNAYAEVGNGFGIFFIFPCLTLVSFCTQAKTLVINSHG